MSLIYRVRVKSTGWGGAPGLNTHYFEDSADPTTADSVGATACITAVRAAWFGMTALFPATTEFTVDPIVDVLTAATGELSTSFGTAPTAVFHGTGGGGYGPTAAMICASLLTDTVINGHRVRGRVFCGPPAAGADADGTPTDGQLALVQGNIATLPGGTGGAPRYVVWHRPVGGAGGATATVTSVVTRDKFAVLRSRRD